MSIDKNEIDHLAELARLDLDQDEKDSLEGDLNEILELAEKIKDVDTEGVDPTYHAMPVTDVTGEDELHDSPDPEKVLKHAPEASDGYFVVPKVIDD